MKHGRNLHCIIQFWTNTYTQYNSFNHASVTLHVITLSWFFFLKKKNEKLKKKKENKIQ
jgi:hypothetical protein